MNENNKITKIALISFISSTPFFLSIFVVFIATFFVLGLFDGDGSSGGSTSQGGNYTYTIDGVNISDIKVRLLKCEGYEPIPGEELIDFETYITGVVSQENGNGPYEALKAQAVAARSYALTRHKEMGGAYGLSLKNEDGQWILQIRNCTNDQVFCNPDKGCWSKVVGGQTGSNVKTEDCTIYTGKTTNEDYWNGPILSNDSIIRKAVNDTQGEVLVNSNGEIFYTTYLSSNQNKWNSLANEGYDYFEILVEEYGSGVSLQSPTYNPPSVEGTGEATGVMINPCPDARVTSEFGPRKRPTAGASTKHKGIDLGAPEGTNIIAADGGTVIVAKWNNTRGYYIDIDHGNGIVTRYQHLSKMLVNVGDKVDISQSIAKVGSTGVSTGAHLHFEVMVNGTHVNPRDYITFPAKKS